MIQKFLLPSEITMQSAGCCIGCTERLAYGGTIRQNMLQTWGIFMADDFEVTKEWARA
jgi:hypothetical protein